MNGGANYKSETPVLSCGISGISVISVRQEPSHKSELVTQILFGEHYKIIEEKNSWLKIVSGFDEYPGWIPLSQNQEIEEKEYAILHSAILSTAGEMFGLIENDGRFFTIFCGSSLPLVNSGIFSFSQKKYKYHGEVFSNPRDIRAFLMNVSAGYLNTPYLWGGRTPAGIDCSGFTQILYKLAGLKLKRDASLQAMEGQALSFVEEALPGDLAFFDNEDGEITHVGMILPNNEIIHASGKVRIDNLDHQGIYNKESNRYTHTLRVIRKYI